MVYIPKYLEVIDQANKLCFKQMCFKLPRSLGLLQPDMSKWPSRASWPPLIAEHPSSPLPPPPRRTSCRPCCAAPQFGPLQMRPQAGPGLWSVISTSATPLGGRPLTRFSRWQRGTSLGPVSFYAEGYCQGARAQPVSQEPRVSPSYQGLRELFCEHRVKFDQKNSSVFMRLCMPPCGISYEHLKT